MDYRSRFNKNTYPNLFSAPEFGNEYQAAHRAYQPPAKTIHPASDSRYPAYAGATEDGRLVTDYRPQCSKNIKPEYQFHTKLWLINHATDVMEESRQRQIEWSGASLPLANTVPPPAGVVHSNPFYSELEKTNLKWGIGVERANAAAPPLFGTFEYEPTIAELQNNRKNIDVTKFYEGGRNTVRGVF
jgi:hypothetical protein